MTDLRCRPTRLEFAIEEAQLRHAELHVTYAYPVMERPVTGSTGNDYYEQVESDAREFLQGVMAKAPSTDGLERRVVGRAGKSRRGPHRRRASEATILVVGSRGVGGFFGLLWVRSPRSACITRTVPCWSYARVTSSDCCGAWEEIRTPDLRITNALLYRLSYPGAESNISRSTLRAPYRLKVHQRQHQIVQQERLIEVGLESLGWLRRARRCARSEAPTRYSLRASPPASTFSTSRSR